MVRAREAPAEHRWPHRKTAHATAAEVVARLDAGSEPLGRTRLRAIVDAYLRWGRGAWSENHFTVTRREVTVRFEPYLHLRAEQVDARLLKGFCNAKSTAHQAKLERSRLRAFLGWGHEEGYFTAAQTELLDKYRYVPNVAPVRKPQRNSPLHRRWTQLGSRRLRRAHGSVRREPQALHRR